MNKAHYIFILFLLISFHAFSQDSTSSIENNYLIKGQLSTWGHFNPDNSFPLYIGGRYIPQLNYEINLPEDRLIDFEVSANLVGDAGIHFFDY